MSASNEAETWTQVCIGESTLVVEVPNTCVVRYVGELDAQTVERMNDALKEVTRHCGSIHLLVDLSRTSGVNQLGRRQGAGGMLALNPAATAVVGASFHLRVVVEMITKAAKLLNTGLRGPVEFFADETKAREWINRLQREAWGVP